MRFAEYDTSATQPAPVVAWYDTTFHPYPNARPPLARVEMTDAEWGARMSQSWGVLDGKLVPHTPEASAEQKRFALLRQASGALALSDHAVADWIDAGEALPDAWRAYRRELRAIVAGTSQATALPAPPGAS